MEQDDLRSAWRGVSTDPRSSAELRTMMQEKNHPVLKRIRKQLIVESVFYAAFLLVYYDFFDGDRKPFYANVLLAAALLLAVVHNVITYVLSRKRIAGDNLRESLIMHLSKMRSYAFGSVITRIVSAAALLFFFGSVIAFNETKYWILAGVLLTLAVQVALLSAAWIKRLKQLKSAVDGLKDA